MNSGPVAFVPGGLVAVEHALAQCGAYTEYEVNTVLFGKAGPLRERACLILWQHAGGRAAQYTLVEKKDAVQAVPFVQYRTRERGGVACHAALGRVTENKKGIDHVGSPRNKKPRCAPGFAGSCACA